MGFLLLPALILALAIQTVSAAPLPPELVGEWASPEAKFDRDLLKEGSAVYLGADGFGALFGAPPPVGMAGTATYDPKTFTFTLDLHDNGKPPETMQATLIYDPKAKTLTLQASADTQKEVFKRRSEKIPAWVLKERK